MDAINLAASSPGLMDSRPSESDDDLVREAKTGSRQAFSELVRRHQRALMRVSLRFARDQALAEDVVQESFIKAYQKLNLFEGRASFKSWLIQIAMNTAKNRLRGRAFAQATVEDEGASPDPGAEREMICGDVRALIRREVDRLPEKQRIALTLRIYEDLSFKEIADAMGSPYDTAKANYRHALLKLRKRLEDEGELDALGAFGDVIPTWGTARVQEAEA